MRNPASPAASILRRRIISSKLADSFLTTDEVVTHLRSHFREYSRLPNNIFANNVAGILTSLRQQHDDEDDSLKERKSARKNGSDSKSRANDSESRLAIQEAKHLQRRRRVDNSSNNSNSSVSSDSSTSTSESTDQDAIFDEKINPEFDLMKSMLRDNYAEKTRSIMKPPPEMEKNMEIETGDRKKRIAMGATGKDGRKMKMGEVPRSREDAAVSNGGPRFKDLGGMNGVLEQLEQEVFVPLCHPKLLEILGVRPISGILLHGPPGCGKTTLAHAIANETGVPFYKISATEVVSGVSGASEENIRDLFKKARRTAPSIIFIDEIDAIASKRENMQREMERRIVTQLMTCMDESYQTTQSNDNNLEGESCETKPKHVLVIGATNRPDAVDQALRRPGRFTREIALGVPDENARFEILSVHIRKLKVEGDFDLMKIARSTPGFVGADLTALVDKAGNLAMKRITDKRKSELEGKIIDYWWRPPWSQDEMDNLCIFMSDFEDAVKMIQPSSTREGFSLVPNTKWDDVGGLKSLRKEFERHIVQRIKKPEDYEALGVNMQVGFLLFGPPGCGKTLIAEAVANESGANFIHIKAAEILNKYVGESELAIRTIFTRARTCSPCILFFDEVDALTTQRGRDGGWVVDRLLAQLLIELDGAGKRQGVYVIGATNRLDVMDVAVLRPGRFGKIFYVPLPNAEERGHILKTLARGKPIAADVDLDAIGRSDACRNLNGADLNNMMNDATMAAQDEKKKTIEKSHFETALREVRPSVSEEQRIYFDNQAKQHKAINAPE